MIECYVTTDRGQSILAVSCECGAPNRQYSCPMGLRDHTFEPYECSCGDNIHVKFSGDSYTVRDRMLRQVYPPQDPMEVQLAALTKRFDEMAATVVAMREALDDNGIYWDEDEDEPELVRYPEDQFTPAYAMGKSASDYTKGLMIDIIQKRVYDACQGFVGAKVTGDTVAQVSHAVQAAMPGLVFDVEYKDGKVTCTPANPAYAAPFNNDEAAEKLLQYINELDAAPGHCVPSLPTISEERKPYSCRCCKTALWLDEASKPCWRCGGIA